MVAKEIILLCFCSLYARLRSSWPRGVEIDVDIPPLRSSSRPNVYRF